MKIYNHCGHTYYAGALGPGSVVLDLGANRGEFSKYLSARFGSKCIAVEPVENLLNKMGDQGLIVKYAVAIADREARADFFLNPNSEAATLLPKDQEGFDRKMDVQTMDLETLLRKAGISEIDLLKVDIEGSETALFRSTPDHVLRKVKQITVEFHDFIKPLKMSDDVKWIIRRLKSLGFFYLNFTGGIFHEDCLFIRFHESKASRLVRFYLFALKSYFAVRLFLKGSR